jgi:hypothetical protein
MYAETPRNKHAAPNLVQDQNKRAKKKKKNTIDASQLQNRSSQTKTSTQK